MNPTQNAILTNATKLFFERGIDNVGIRDIASLANVNVASVNYYFRSKDELIITIINEKTELLYIKLNHILNAPTDLRTKISQYTDTFIDLLSKDSGIVIFLLSTLQSKPELMMRSKLSGLLFNEHTAFFQQLKTEGQEGKIKIVHPEQFYISMLALILFPFSIDNMIAHQKNYTPAGLNKFIKSRKKMVADMLLAYLYNG